MRRPSAVLVFLLVLGVFVVLLAPRILQVRSLGVRSKNLEIEVRKLKLENLKLENELRSLRDDPVYLEKVAREKFNKAKQGEIVYKVVREGSEPNNH